MAKKLTKNEKYIVEQYVRYFGKAPSVAEIAKYDEFGKQKLILEEISGEAKASKAGLTTVEIVNSTYQNLFGRDADPKEMNKYSKVVDADKDLPINAIVKAAKPSDKAVYQTKKAVALFIAEEGSTTNFDLDKITNDTYAEIYNPRTKKLSVNSVEELKTKIDAMPDNGSTPNVPGETFTLTADSGDILVLTAKNNTVEAGTFLEGKTIFDQGGIDTLNATLTSGLTTSTIIQGVENINIKWDAFSDATVNANKITGATTITLTSEKLGYLGNATVTNAGANNVVAGAGIKGDLTVSDVTTGNVNAANAKTVTVDAKGGTTDESTTVTAGATTTKMTVGNAAGKAFDNATVIAGAATTDITVKGDKTVNVTTDALTKTVATTSNATTINAAKIAKDAVITLNKAGTAASTATVTVGNNATVTNADLTGKITLDVAAGKTVTLTGLAAAETFDIKGTGDVTLKATAANLTTDTITKSNTGTLTVDTSAGTLTAATLDTSKVAADLIKVQATNTAAIISAKSGQSFEVSAAASNATLTVGVATDGSADTLKLKLTSAAYAKLTNNAANDIETLTIEAAAAQATGAATAIDLTITDLVAGDNKVVLTGTNDVEIKTVTSAKEIDASALNGTLKVGSTAAVATGVIAGATGVNTIAFGDVAADKSVTFVGQGGNDVITLKTTAAAGAAAGSKAGQANIVAGAGDDTLTVSGIISGVLSAQMGAGNDTVKLEAGPAVTTSTVVIEFGEGTDTLDLTGSGNGIDVSGANLTLTGLENIKIDGTGAKFNGSTLNGQKYTILGTSATADKFTVETHATNDENIDLSGLTVTDSVSTGIKGATITGGNGVNVLTGTSRDDTIDGRAGDDIINGGAGDDTITGGTGADILTGGAGDDIFKFTTGDSTATVTDKITDFVGSSDKISVVKASGATATGTKFTSITDVGSAISGAADLAAATTAAYTLLGTNDATKFDAIQFTYGAKTYFAVENGDSTGATGAIVIEVTGLTGTVIDTDFVVA